jgi:hypothetical protein
MKKLIMSLWLVFFTGLSYAQTQEIEMADVMRSNGKIYVVLGIVLLVLTGFILYLFLLDRKLTRLEKKLKQ